MKRQNPSASLNSSTPSPKENSKQIYSREFQAMLDSLDEEDHFVEEAASQYRSSQKKRRLRTDQVKALEKNFEADNKLEPERKLKLAVELGLEQRQVAIWFQNRRARWKTKELEKDYGLLKASFDALKSQYDHLQQKREALTTEMRGLKANPEEESNDESVKEEPSDGNSNFGSLKEERDQAVVNVQLLTWPEAAAASSSSSSSSLQFNGSSSTSSSSVYSWVRSSDSGMAPSHCYDQVRLVKVEEQSDFLFNAEESTCNFFSVDQPPTLQWYFQGH